MREDDEPSTICVASKNYAFQGVRQLYPFRLTISSCPNFEFLEQQQQKYDLVELQIDYSCDSLCSLSLDVFPNLKNLQIKWCRNLESVSMSEAPHAALQRLTIFGCDKLVSFAGEGLAAPNLTHLQVGGITT
ncbi:hypothetical protein AHAS_Ahas02G0076800 [Arachis hypogaea]